MTADATPKAPAGARWTVDDPGPGRWVVNLSSYADFDAYIREEMLDYRHFVWRGHAASAWKLEPTLDRLMRRRGKTPDERVSAAHLDRFKFAARGRRGPSPQPMTDNEWWALGQHNGLATPLLDWTRSPYVAAYFAYASEANDGADRRAVIGISTSWVAAQSDAIRNEWKGLGRPPIVEFISPLTDDNSRLVNQGGLFTRAPDGVDITGWVSKHIDANDTRVRLLTLTMPNDDRLNALRWLNRMNINHLSLFPDLYGAAKFVNLDLTVDKY